MLSKPQLSAYFWMGGVAFIGVCMPPHYVSPFKSQFGNAGRGLERRGKKKKMYTQRYCMYNSLSPRPQSSNGYRTRKDTFDNEPRGNSGRGESESPPPPPSLVTALALLNTEDEKERDKKKMKR